MITFKEYLNQVLAGRSASDDPFVAASNVERREKGEPDFLMPSEFALDLDAETTGIRWLMKAIELNAPRESDRVYIKIENESGTLPAMLWEYPYSHSSVWVYTVEVKNPNFSINDSHARYSMLGSLEKGLNNTTLGQVAIVNEFTRDFYVVSHVEPIEHGCIVYLKVIPHPGE
jgi:hypothetical protein